MRELGLFGLSIPEEYGGLGLTMEEECLVGIELGRTSPAFRSAFGTNVGIGSQGLVMFGNDAQKAKWLPGIASGKSSPPSPSPSPRPARIRRRCRPGPGGRGRLCPRRRQALHHQRQQGGPVHGDGPH